MPRRMSRIGTTVAASIIAMAWSSAGLAAKWPTDERHGACAVTKQENVPAKMRDGTVLRADVYTPATSEPVPVILMRTQYGKSSAQIQPSRYQAPAWYASHCYIVVIQDVRGQYASDGKFYEYANERSDGYDSVEWAARLPGSSGKVGMYGSSYVGATQWLAATGAPPSLKAIAPSNTASDYYDGWTYENGAFRLSFVQPWMLDLAATSADQRKDVALASSIRQAEKSAASWMGRHPYSALPPLKPGDPVVAPWYYDTIQHDRRDAYWKAFQIEGHYDKVTVPVLAFDGWYDSFLGGAITNFQGMRKAGGSAAARQHQRLVIGPWEHIGWGRPDSQVSPRLKAIGSVANSTVNDLMISFFDHFLKGKENGFEEGPRIDYFTMGENLWHHAVNWPPEGTQYRSLYLASGGHAASVMGNGLLVDTAPDAGTSGGGALHAPTEVGGATAAITADAASDSFVYDPANPVPSMGGHSCCASSTAAVGQFDQTPIEQRPDILVYTGPALDRPVNVSGPVIVKLFARTTAVDTDFTAKLVDVFPDGSAVNISNGILRARFRDSLETPRLLVPGQVYALTISLWSTSNVFLPGHHIRLEISSSDYPQFDPNPNTGASFGKTVAFTTAVQTILHDSAHPSALLLPTSPVSANNSSDRAPID